MKIGLFGCGAYGLALSSILISNNNQVIMWTNFEEEKLSLEKNMGNEKLLPNFRLSPKVKVTTNVANTIIDRDLLIIAIPAQYISELVKKIAPYIKNNHILIATKGIDEEQGLFIDELLIKGLHTKNIAVISGPTFAIDLINNLPVGLTLATKNNITAQLTVKALANNYVKLRRTTDVIGTEICGSIKNIIAIASGILTGLGASDSTRAMLLTEASHDMMSIIEIFHGDKKTILSFAGFGDLLLTCTSQKSRNYTFGIMIGEKHQLTEINSYLKKTTVEGYNTLKSIYKLLKNKNVSVPIIDLIYDIVLNGKDPQSLFTFLITKE